jgi:hypothetical protein
MTKQRHGTHPHTHASGCEHPAIAHEGHVDYLHDGHLHRIERDHVIECLLAENAANPADCTPTHSCGAHDSQHTHGSGFGHQSVPHGQHTDYWVGGHLHHPHGEHCRQPRDGEDGLIR